MGLTGEVGLFLLRNWTCTKTVLKIFLINKLVLYYFRSCKKKDKDNSKEKVAVKSVSFTVPKGQVFGLLGKKKPNSNSTQSGV